MTRFMKPRFFDPKQQDAVEAILEQLEIGDPEGRRIFVLAIEYELAEYEKYSDMEPVPEEEGGGDSALRDISEAASALSGILKSLSDSLVVELCGQLSNADIYSRSYDKAYLSALSVELERIASALRAPDRQPASSRGRLGEAESRFIEMFAEAYADCFETIPSPDATSPFALLLNHVVQIAGLEMLVKETDLREILGQENR